MSALNLEVAGGISPTRFNDMVNVTKYTANLLQFIGRGSITDEIILVSIMDRKVNGC